jgi:phage tail-like protein
MSTATGVRAAAPELAVATSLGRGLPAAFLGDGAAAGFPAAFVSAFDAVLAPVVATLDDLDAYLDPGTAPEDFLRWLAGWVSLDTEQRWTTDELRARVGGAAAVYAWLGTVRGIVEGVELVCGLRPEVTDTGAAGWSPRPGSRIPGEVRGEIVVRVPAGVDVPTLDRVVAYLKPAHVGHRLEVG